MKILVVEDEKKIADFIKKGLEEEGYIVKCSYDGKDALDVVNNEKFDLIILDLMLPTIDGITFCKELRKKNNIIPILILSAKNSTGDKVSGLDSGADDYLTKPFDFEELLARVRALLRKSNLTNQTKLIVDDLVLDLITHKVTRGNKEIILTSKEYSLLEYLMRNSGTIITRSMIIEHVWDMNCDSFTNIIDVYINYLRNKIDKDFKNQLIYTVRGKGYIIKAPDDN